ncbi:Uncharacterised protein [Amycolatopsis camponoti]|uniref:Uncharacterized protein n=1 Tax=Amycolatopsis camponoti TaxID=2606593 RepID=A0A6I8LEL1_9PSEU|nr:Uncharacterised protein [Amycolatopsis camponoti]
MRVLAVILIAAVTWATFFNITKSAQSLNGYNLTAAIIVAVAVGAQRISAVQRWLTAPKSKRQELIEGVAQRTLVNLCRNCVVTDTLLELRVHIWEVPLWYRKIFPYRFRVWWKHLPVWDRLTRVAIRPALKRTAAVGLMKHAPSGVKFRKGRGLVGVCIANNIRAEILILDANDETYQQALAAGSEEEWQEKGVDITKNLSLEDAKRLAALYGFVIARVLQDGTSGEATGCVTISVTNANDPDFDFSRNERFKEALVDCAMTVSLA